MRSGVAVIATEHRRTAYGVHGQVRPGLRGSVHQAWVGGGQALQLGANIGHAPRDHQSAGLSRVGGILPDPQHAKRPRAGCGC